ncbi:MAG: efflux RND transporter periplasmic adaptor subunit [Deltaproteobacteria bacterium]|nr:efflux RND transporter periplasmic adaptor subunit [Deltaproteobacteria bacterium]
MRKKWIILGIVVIAILAGAVFLINMKKKEVTSLAKPQPYRQTVQAAAVSQGRLEVTTHYLGVIEPYTRSDLSARISGNILSLPKREGDLVHSGELLAVIDDRELADRAQAIDAEALATQQRIAGAQSAYEMQKSISERDATLYKEGAISKEALERSQAALDGVRATLLAFQETLQGLKKNATAARTQTGYAKITSPFDGIVSKRWSDLGEMAVLGKPLLTVEKSSPYKVMVQIPQEEIGRVKRGTKVYLLNGDKRLTAAVDRAYPALGRNLLGTIEIILAARPFNLSSGATVGVDLVASVVEGLLVPENAVVKSGRGVFVYAVDGNVVKIRLVTLLGTGAGRAALSGQLRAGERVAVGQENRLLSLKEGSAVEPVEYEARP